MDAEYANCISKDDLPEQNIFATARPVGLGDIEPSRPREARVTRRRAKGSRSSTNRLKNQMSPKRKRLTPRLTLRSMLP